MPTTSLTRPLLFPANLVEPQESSLSRRNARGVTVEPEARMRSMVTTHRHFVARTLLSAGVPQSDLDDEVQRTFVIAARRLEDVRLGSEHAFLYRVARNTAAHAQRSRMRRREVPSGDLPDVANRSDEFAPPEILVQRRQMWKLLTGALDRMRESLRAVFVLYDLEGMPRSEVATLLKLPAGTVASQVRLARKEVRTLVARKLASEREAVD